MLLNLNLITRFLLPADNILLSCHCKTDTASTKAEIIWTLKSAINGFSVHSNDHFNDTFVSMFPDSDIAQQFSVVCMKSMYVINHGLALFFKSQLTDNLKKSHIHSFSFDESLNDVTQTSGMDLYVRYWDMNASQVSILWLKFSWACYA